MPTFAEDPRGLVAAADAALYEAKRGGKNRVAEPPVVKTAERSGS